SFSNPFHDGRADRLSPLELLRYTFAALEAWAYERDLGRQKGETPLEFADRVAGEGPPLEQAVERFVALYVRAVYGRYEVSGGGGGPWGGKGGGGGWSSPTGLRGRCRRWSRPSSALLRCTSGRCTGVMSCRGRGGRWSSASGKR